MRSSLLLRFFSIPNFFKQLVKIQEGPAAGAHYVVPESFLL